MTKVRNAVIIIILCIIGAGLQKKVAPNLSLGLPALEDMKDALSGRGIRLAQPNEDPLPIEDLFHEQGVQPRATSNTLGDIPTPPRGMGNGGFDPLPFQPAPQQLSPSGPAQ